MDIGDESPFIASTLGAPPLRLDLSARETEVMELMTEGMTNREIAVRLRVTVHAVKFHLASVYRKLNVHNRTEAAVAFLSASGALKARR